MNSRVFLDTCKSVLHNHLKSAGTTRASLNKSESRLSLSHIFKEIGFFYESSLSKIEATI
jgi:hypothetical protein